MFWTRTFSFTVLLAVFLTAVLDGSAFGKGAFMLLSALLAYGAVWEFLTVYGKLQHPSFPKVSATAAAVILLSTFSSYTYRCQYGIYGLITILICGAWFMLLFGRNSREYLTEIVNSCAGTLIILLPLLPLVLIYGDGSPERRWQMLFLILVTKAGDTGAYIVGTAVNRFFGRNHKIIPGISPKKSWEGTIGGMLLSIIISLWLWRALLEQSGVIMPVAVGTVLFWGGFCGDLAESVLKRTAGVKDSNNVIPGMGGVLDVVDSLLLNAALFYFIFLPFIK